MKITNASNARKRKNFRRQVLEEQKRNQIIFTISSYLFSHRAQHFGLDNLCPIKIYSSILNLAYDNNGDTFFERYPDESFKEAINDLSIIIYTVIKDTNILELRDLQLEPEEIRDVLIGHFMSYYKYTGKESFFYASK